METQEAVQNKIKRPLGITLLGYLLLLSALGSAVDMFAVFKGSGSDGLVLGFYAPSPLPEIELGLMMIWSALCGVFLLKMTNKGRILTIALMTWNIVSLANGMIVSNGPAGDGTTFSQILNGEATALGILVWGLTVFFAAGIMGWIVVYLLKVRKYFV